MIENFEFDPNFPELYWYVFSWQYAIIGSDNGLALNRQQTIIWTKDGLVCWQDHLPIDYSSLILDEGQLTGLGGPA